MAVISTPDRARLRITYFEDEAKDMRLNGINPQTTPMQFTLLANALQTIQAATVEDGFLVSEFELSEA